MREFYNFQIRSCETDLSRSKERLQGIADRLDGSVRCGLYYR